MKGLSNIKRTAKLVGLKLKKYSPEILTVAGCTGSVVALVMACKETTKLEETLDICKERKITLENFKEEAYKTENCEYFQKAYKRDLAKITVMNAVDIVKLYAPAAAVELASLSMIFASNGIQRKRNASLAAAYLTLDNMFKKYRENVVDTYGEEVDHDMRFGVKHEKVEVIETDENGKEHKVKKTIAIVDPDDPNNFSDYARFYDSSVPGWDKNAEYNMMKLKANQEYANQLLRVNGYLFLNDVYKIIGFKESIAGQSVGWIYDPVENADNDNYIDFGLTNFSNANRRFVNGYEPVVLLDFNVDGDLLSNPKLNNMLNKCIARK